MNPSESAKEGRDLAARSSVVFCGIVRDCGRNLAANLRRVEALRPRFRELKLVLVENDSKDNTKDVLRKLQQQDPSALIEMSDHGTVTLPKRMKSGVLPSYSEHRISKLSSYRNRYLELIEDRIGTDQIDFVVMLDWDVLSFTADGLFDSLGQSEHWDVATANGCMKWRWHEEVYYDLFAYLPTGARGARNLEEIQSHRPELSALPQDGPLLRVESAFGGLGIYRAADLQDLRYRAEINDDSKIECWCEHITFHRDLAARGANRVVINPRMSVAYISRAEAIAKVVRGWLRPLAHLVRPPKAT